MTILTHLYSHPKASEFECNSFVCRQCERRLLLVAALLLSLLLLLLLLLLLRALSLWQDVTFADGRVQFKQVVPVLTHRWGKLNSGYNLRRGVVGLSSDV